MTREPPPADVTASPAEPGLQRALSPLSLFMLAFGTIIGVGWVTILGAWLSDAGSVGAILAFVIGGLMMIPIALCYAELAGMYPVAGGEVAYFYTMFGERAAFFVGWVLVYLFVATTSFEAISVGWVLGAIFPGIEGPVVYTVLGAEVRLGSLLCGILGMVAITAINWWGVKWFDRFQSAVVVLLLVASLVFVAAGMIRGDRANLEPLFIGEDVPTMALGVLAVLATAPFWYGGFDTVPQAMGEARRDPQNLRKLSRVMIVSIGVAMLFYVLVILTAAISIDREKLLSFDLPVAGALEEAFGHSLPSKIALFAGLCGLVTTWNAVFYSATRLLFAMGRARMIPGAFAVLDVRFRSPATAICFVGVVGTLGSLAGREAVHLIAGSSSLAFSVLFVLTVIGVARLRRRVPDHPRPYRVPGGAAGLLVAGIIGAAILAVSFFEPLASASGVPIEWFVLAAWATLGAAFWVLARRTREARPLEERRAAMLEEGTGAEK